MIEFLNLVILAVIAVLVYKIWKEDYVVPTITPTPILPEPEETGDNDKPDPLEYPGEIVKDPIDEPETPVGHPFDKPSQPFEDPDLVTVVDDPKPIDKPAPELHKPELEPEPVEPPKFL